MIQCQGCDKKVNEDSDHLWHEEVVRLGDGTIDDRFWICDVCIERGREEEIEYLNREWHLGVR